MKRITVKPPGQRILRSVCSVFLCFMIYYLRGCRGLPFYSAIAALQCIQPYQESAVKMGRKRVTGTFVGAFWGLIVILLKRWLAPTLFDAQMTSYILISLFIGVVLYSTVLIGCTDSSYFSCVVFLSITIIHSGDENPFLFVFDRVTDTLIGVALALLVNKVHMPRKKKKDILFVSGIDDTILTSKDELTAYSKIELNRLIDQGMQFTVSTLRTPANVREVLDGIHLRLPIIAMDGAVLYDMKNNSYLKAVNMDGESAARMAKFLKTMDVGFFINVVVDDLLVIYYKYLGNAAQEKLYEKMHISPYRNYVKRPLPDGESVTYFMMLEEKEKSDHIYWKLKEQPWCTDYKIISYDSHDYPGYKYIKIYSKEATRANMLQSLKDVVGMEKTMTFGSIEGKYDVVIKNSNGDIMVKKLKKKFEPLIWSE